MWWSAEFKGTALPTFLSHAMGRAAKGFVNKMPTCLDGCAK
jgi:hypothetical protein